MGSSPQLSQTTYQGLLNDIAQIHDRAMKNLSAAVDSVLKKAYWEIGRRIVEVEQKGDPHAPYGKHLLENLSNDLTKMNRKGFSKRNLFNMRRVYLAFPILQLTAKLTWTHYVALASIRDEKQRKAYTQKAIQKKWDVHELQKALENDKVALNVIDTAQTKALPAPAKDSKDAKVIRLAVNRGILHTYKVAGPEDKSSPKDSLWIDCGFFIEYELKGPELKKPDGPLPKPGELIATLLTAEGYTVKTLDAQGLVPKSVLYTYAAKVVKVIDADTLTVFADLGFGIFSKQKLRLRRINAPELSTPSGRKAREFVVRRLKSSAGVVIKTYSTDIFDRYLVDVFYLPGSEDAEKIAREGILLNQQLIDEGLAQLWQRPDLQELAFLN